jgi:predicted transcriptional regulator
MEVLNQEQQSPMAEKQSFDDYAITPRSDLEQGNKEPRGRNYFRAETLPRFKNRNSIVIISDILEAASCPALKTSLMHQTQSSYAMISAYLKFGLERGLLKKICGPEGTQYYKTT